ncbi:MAG: hypothetical protein ACMXYG_04180 [Candidatus Woesearchaeota archaeon]
MVFENDLEELISFFANSSEVRNHQDGLLLLSPDSLDAYIPDLNLAYSNGLSRILDTQSLIEQYLAIRSSYSIFVREFSTWLSESSKTETDDSLVLNFDIFLSRVEIYDEQFSYFQSSFQSFLDNCSYRSRDKSLSCFVKNQKKNIKKYVTEIDEKMQDIGNYKIYITNFLRKLDIKIITV